MSWILYVARRFLDRRGRSSGVSALSALGIGAGVMTLIAVLGVMNGFQRTTIESILELGSFHLQISCEGCRDQDDRAVAIAELRENPDIRAVIPFMEVETLAHGFWPEPQGVAVRAVPEDWLVRDVGARDQIQVVAGTFDISRPGSVVLGSELAAALGLRVGDPVQFMYLPGSGGAPRDTELTVVGMIRSGYLDYDRTWAITSLETAQLYLSADGGLRIGIKLQNRRNGASVAEALSSRFPAETIMEWEEFNAGIFGALRVEKSMMIFLIGLIFIVVGTNIFQSLRRGIFERAEDIAILRALGAPTLDVQLIFVLEGALIGLAGAVLGTAAGLLIAYNINDVFGVVEYAVNGLLSVFTLLREEPVEEMSIFSPAYFYLTDVPVVVFPREVVGISGAAVLSSLSAAWFAVRRLRRYNPSEVLRDE